MEGQSMAGWGDYNTYILVLLGEGIGGLLAVGTVSSHLEKCVEWQLGICSSLNVVAVNKLVTIPRQTRGELKVKY